MKLQEIVRHVRMPLVLALLVLSVIANAVLALKIHRDTVALEVGHRTMKSIAEQQGMLAKVPEGERARLEQFLGETWVEVVRKARLPTPTGRD